MKEFEKWWEENSGDYKKWPHSIITEMVKKHEEDAWKAALEGVLDKVNQSNSDGSIIQYIKDELKEE